MRLRDVMNAPQENFQTYLRGEVDTAGKRFEQTVEQVYALTSRQPGPELLGATRELSENFRLYAGALRRMANVASHRADSRQTAHA